MAIEADSALMLYARGVVPHAAAISLEDGCFKAIPRGINWRIMVAIDTPNCYEALETDLGGLLRLTTVVRLWCDLLVESGQNVPS